MGKPNVPKTEGTIAGQPESRGTTESEKEPISPETSAKAQKNFTTEESSSVKGKDSVPPDSTAQRGKTPSSSSEEDNKKK